MAALRCGIRSLLCASSRTVQTNLVTRALCVTTPKCADGKKLFTPGPLSVSRSTKEAMLWDFGSRETDFIQLVKDLRSGVVEMAGVSDSDFTCVPMQGSGTFALEAVLSTTVPREGGKVLVLENGAYGQRQVAICKMLGIDFHHESFGERDDVSPQRVADILSADNSFTHVTLVHCETSTGIFNNIHEVGLVVKKHAPNAAYFVDAMSTFGAVPLSMADSHIDYMVSSANKCIQGVPGFSFAVCRLDHLKKCKGNSRSLSLDLVAQYEGLAKDGQFRFTPPTHAMLAFKQALLELEQEGGVSGRAARYQSNRECLRKGMEKMGFKEVLPKSIAGYIITSYLYPEDPNFDFTTFYNSLYAKDLVIYTGKLSEIKYFRLGNIGDLHKADIEELLVAIQLSCEEMGVKLPLS